VRKQGTVTEVLMHRRAADASLMAGMLELPPLREEAVTGREPLLRVRHSITNTNYYVQVFASRSPRDKTLMKALMGRDDAYEWVRTTRLAGQPLTGLARKVLQRLEVMAVRPVVWTGPVPMEAQEGEPA
jgi:A/G-specific adenine glycosylase